MKPNEYGEILWWVNHPRWNGALTFWAVNETALIKKVRYFCGYSRGPLPKKLEWWHNEKEWWESEEGHKQMVDNARWS